jgi:DNA end-binding protein Ku
MARSLWRGNISFGLINIPISIASAENPQDRPEFNLIDKRDYGHIGYQKINKNTGKIVDNKNIVKGLKLDSGKYSIFDQTELDHLRLKGSESIDLQQFVDQDEIDPAYFEKPYFLLPEKGGKKAYVLLREALRKTRKFGVGILVMHSKQHLVLIRASGPALALEVIRYQDELRSVDEYEFPAERTKEVKISSSEFGMAERLIDELTDKWKPQLFKDTFHEELLKAVKKKKKVEVVEAPETAREESVSASKVLDLMPLLEKSISARGKKNSGRVSKRKKAS